MDNYYIPGEGQVTKWDVYFVLYRSLLRAEKRIEELKKPEAMKATYDFILSCYRELQEKLPETPNQEIFLKSTQRQY